MVLLRALCRLIVLCLGESCVACCHCLVGRAVGPNSTTVAVTSEPLCLPPLISTSSAPPHRMSTQCSGILSSQITCILSSSFIIIHHHQNPFQSCPQHPSRPLPSLSSFKYKTHVYPTGRSFFGQSLGPVLDRFNWGQRELLPGRKPDMACRCQVHVPRRKSGSLRRRYDDRAVGLMRQMSTRVCFPFRACLWTWGGAWGGGRWTLTCEMLGWLRQGPAPFRFVAGLVWFVDGLVWSY